MYLHRNGIWAFERNIAIRPIICIQSLYYMVKCIREKEQHRNKNLAKNQHSNLHFWNRREREMVWLSLNSVQLKCENRAITSTKLSSWAIKMVCWIHNALCSGFLWRMIRNVVVVGVAIIIAFETPSGCIAVYMHFSHLADKIVDNDRIRFIN